MGERIEAERNDLLVADIPTFRSPLQRVKVPGVGVGDFVLCCGGQIFAIEKFLYQIVEIRACRFVGKVRGPEQAIVAEQLDIALRRALFAALKEKLLPRKQLAR